MAEPLTTEPIPLVSGDDGVMRVRGTRVTLETVLSAFADGANAGDCVVCVCRWCDRGGDRPAVSVDLAGRRISGNWILSAACVRTGPLPETAAPGHSRDQKIQRVHLAARGDPRSIGCTPAGVALRWLADENFNEI